MKHHWLLGNPPPKHLFFFPKFREAREIFERDFFRLAYEASGKRPRLTGADYFEINGCIDREREILDRLSKVAPHIVDLHIYGSEDG